VNRLAVLLIRLLGALFAIGVLGSALVLVLTSIEDVKVLFGFEHDRSQATGSEK